MTEEHEEPEFEDILAKWDEIIRVSKEFLAKLNTLKGNHVEHEPLPFVEMKRFETPELSFCFSRTTGNLFVCQSQSDEGPEVTICIKRDDFEHVIQALSAATIMQRTKEGT